MMDSMDERIMGFIRDNPGCTNRQICEAFGYKTRGYDYQKVQDHTKSLAKFGFLDFTREETHLKTIHYTVKVGA